MVLKPRVPARRFTAVRAGTVSLMVELGYALSSEELAPVDLVKNAARAERAGFGFALVSDHFHPWLDAQGESPFVWSVIGAISRRPRSLTLGTGVTCPTDPDAPGDHRPGRRDLRGADAGTLLPRRRHRREPERARPRRPLAGPRAAPGDARGGGRGDARAVAGRARHPSRRALHGRPRAPLHGARGAAADRGRGGRACAAELAGRIGDAFISTAPDEELVQAFRDAGGEGKPCYGQLTICYGEDRR